MRVEEHISGSGPVLLYLLPQSGPSAIGELGWIISFCKAASVIVAIVPERTWRALGFPLGTVAVPWQVFVWTSWSNLLECLLDVQTGSLPFIYAIHISSPVCLPMMLLHCVPSLFNLVSPRRQKSTMRQIFFTVICFDTKAHVFGRIITPRPDFLPNGIFVVISNGFGPQLV